MHQDQGRLDLHVRPRYKVAEGIEELFRIETSDQVNAQQDTKKDMESEKIMDRLICGMSA